MNTHDKIAEKLTSQLQLLEEALLDVRKAGIPTTPTKTSFLAAQSFATQIRTSDGVAHSSTLMQLDRAGAESFLKLARYAVEIYSKHRILTTEQFSDSGRQFSWLAELVRRYSVEIERGAPSPFGDT